MFDVLSLMDVLNLGSIFVMAVLSVGIIQLITNKNK